MPYAEMVLYGP